MKRTLLTSLLMLGMFAGLLTWPGKKLVVPTVTAQSTTQCAIWLNNCMAAAHTVYLACKSQGTPDNECALLAEENLSACHDGLANIGCSFPSNCYVFDVRIGLSKACSSGG